MKKRILFAALTFAAFNVNAQQPAGVEDKLREAQCATANETIAAALKNTENPKKNIKGGVWLKLGDAYKDAALSCGKDSLISEKAYNAYKKALEVDAATGGGKDKKDIEAAISGPESMLYSALMSQGAALYSGQNLKDGLTLFKLASDVKPSDTTSTLYAGIVSQQLQDFTTAKSYFEKFISQNGKDPAVFYSLSVLKKNDKDYDGAVAILKKGIEANPRDKDLRGELINTYIAANKLNDALEDLKQMVANDPKNVTNTLNLGILYDNSGNKEEAFKYYNKVLELEPTNYDCNFNIGVMYFNEAVETKKKVDAMDIKTYQKEGKAVEEQVCKQFNTAKPYFDKCAALNPKDEVVAENLVNLNRILGQCK
jgi:tetratricopeptide (TPR) repeat protein